MWFGADRHQMRAVFYSAWKKYRDPAPLDGVESQIVAVILKHPEYHALLNDPASGLDRDWVPESGAANPFLHLAMHVAIEEQLSVDRPAGIRDRYQNLVRKLEDDHAAQHVVMECLGEMLWNAGRAGTTPDEQRYLQCLDEQARIP